MIVVTTPTGNIGCEVVRQLLAAGEAVRVLARDPAKLAPEVRDRADVVQGSLDDQDVVSRALSGAESLFLVVPPSFTTTDIDEYYLRFTRPACRAIRQHGTRRVVAVSALGKGETAPLGPVTASFLKNDAIRATGVDFRALECPSFMENMLMQLEPLKRDGAFYLPGDPDRKMRFVATRDIASSGVRLLLDRSWSGQGGLAVLGPEDLSLNQLASTMSEVLGKPIRFQPVPVAAYQAQLIKVGASEHFAQGLADLYTAKNNGLDSREPRTPENTTPTTFRQWCEQVLKPAFGN